MQTVHINTGLVKAPLDLSRYQQQAKGHTEKGRAPINSREATLQAAADATSTKIARWCRYDEGTLARALVRLAEASNVKNKAAYFIWLVKNP